MKRESRMPAVVLLTALALSISAGSVLAEAGGGKPDKAEKSESSSGSGKSALGNLNAANASANARLHASSGSMVGKIALYEKLENYRLCQEAASEGCVAALEGLTEEQVAEVELGTLTADAVLIEAANKPVSEETDDGEVLLETVRNAINSLLGIGQSETELAPVEEAGATE